MSLGDDGAPLPIISNNGSSQSQPATPTDVWQGIDRSVPAVEQGRALVDGLYSFRDRYFETRDVVEWAVQKKSDVETRTRATVEALDSLEELAGGKEKAVYFMLKGKALNILPDYLPECQEMLMSSIKLNPKLAEAWCQLGECHWKRGDVQAAHNCFKSALDHQKDKQVLRNLSMVLRNLSTQSVEHRTSQLTESVTKAREAVQLDIRDGISWMVLGNAYVSAFFNSPVTSAFMDKAMSAYSQAAKDPIARADHDLHYNWGVAFQYQDDFERALSSFHLASQLDPTWDAPLTRHKTITNFLTQLDSLLKARGRVKEKRLRKLTATLETNRTRDLGPFAGGSFKSTSTGNEVPLEFARLSELKEGSNSGLVVLVRVLCGVPSDTDLVLTLLVVDEAGTLFPLRLFNLGAGVGPSLTDSLAIPDPFLESVTLSTGLPAPLSSGLVGPPTPAEGDATVCSSAGPPFVFRCLRVPMPDVLVVNGRRINSRWTGMPILQNKFFSE